MKIYKIFKNCRNSQDINIGELKNLLRVNKDLILLDVRSPQEYREGHLNGATNIPLYELEICCDCKLRDKEKTIIVYCQSGIRSKKAIKVLNKCGYRNLYHLKGGLDAI